MAVAGPPAPPSAAIPSFAVACGLVWQRYSCLVVTPHRRHVALAPRYLARKRTGIRAQLDAELLRYSERCGRGRGLGSEKASACLTSPGPVVDGCDLTVNGAPSFLTAFRVCRWLTTTLKWWAS